MRLHCPPALAALLSVGLSLSCQTTRRTGGLEDAAVRSEELDVVSQDLQDLQLRDILTFDAPAGTRLTHVHLELLANHRTLSATDKDVRFTASPDGTLVAVLNQETRYAESLKDMEDLQKQGSFRLTAAGTATLIWQGLRKRVDFHRMKEVRSPRLLVVTVKDVAAAHYDNGESNLVFTLAVQNPNPFPVRLKDLPYSLRVAGETLEESVVAQADQIGANTTDAFELQAFIDASREELNQRIERMQEVPYSISGEVNAELYSKPFTVKGKLALRNGG